MKHSAIMPGLLVCLLLILLAGCAETRVVSVPNRDVIGLDADDIVIMMDCAGFGQEQILEHGPEIRNALASTGAARMTNGAHVEAVFSVSGQKIYISSFKRGSFIYDNSQNRCE